MMFLMRSASDMFWIGCEGGICRLPSMNGLRRHHPRLAKLRSALPAGGADEDRRWHLLVNRPIEIEA